MDPIARFLRDFPQTFASVVPVNWREDPYLPLDLSADNVDLLTRDFQDTAAFNTYVFRKIADSQAVAAVGGYGENRVIYRRSPHFDGAEPRTIHLGVDIWMAAGTPVSAPLAGTLHSFRDNAGFGDYGPTVILEHELENHRFYTLYGHLSRASLQNLHTGKTFRPGEKLGEIGNFPENGDWPPHLHFQVIADMQGMKGDFPGVCAQNEWNRYRQLCPDPNFILRIPGLDTNAV